MATQTEVRVLLEEDETDRWLRMAAGGRYDAMDLLMTALVVGYSELTGSRVLYLCDLDSDRNPGFPDVNLARTVGCVAGGCASVSLADSSSTATADGTIARRAAISASCAK